MRLSTETLAADFALLYPPYNNRGQVGDPTLTKSRIPGGCRDSSLPRVWGCPPYLNLPQEWGTRGLKGTHRVLWPTKASSGTMVN